MDMREVRQMATVTSLLFRKASREKIPLSGTFEVSPVCNFSCKMCYVKRTLQEVQQHDRPLMTTDQWLEIAKEARKQGMLYLLLTGGEPFLWPDFWKLYDELSQMGFVLSINTNGSMIDQSAIKRLKKHPPSRINITLYGVNDDTYRELCGIENIFSKVDKAICGLKEAGIEVKLNCSLTPHNAGDLEQIVQYAKDRDVILSTNTYMFPPVRRDEKSIGYNERFTPQEAVDYNLERYRLQYGDDIYKQFLEKVMKRSIPPPGLAESCIDLIDGKIRCRAGNASFWITWDGWMTPCGMMPEPKIDIVKEGFSDSWKQLISVSDNIRLSGICNKCPNQELCHACVAMAWAETGSTEGIPNYLCQMVERLRQRAQDEI